MKVIITFLLVAGLIGEATAEDYKYVDKDGKLVPAEAGLVIPGIMESDKYRVRACLNGLWGFAPAQEATTLEKFLDSNPKWQPLKVPSWYGARWISVIKGGDNDGAPFGWYRVRFTLPGQWKGRRFRLFFDGLAYGCRVYLNGEQAGFRTWYRRRPLYIDITDFIKLLPEENSLYVFLTSHDSEVAKKEGVVRPVGQVRVKGSKDMARKVYASRSMLYPQWPNEWGIFRDVYLEVYPQVHVGDVFVIPSVRKKELKIGCQIKNETNREKTVQVWNEVWDGERKVKESKLEDISLKPAQSQEIEFSIPWAEPRCWSPEDPYLYELKTIIKDRDTADMKSMSFGFREFWVAGGNFYLNGKRICLRSLNDNIFGVATYKEDLSQMTPEYAEAAIKLAKETGYNYYRSHTIIDNYPEYVYELFDRLGLMVGHGLPGFNASIRSVALAIYKGEVDLHTHPIKEDCIGVIKFLRNHPSIVIWEAANELLGYQPPREEYKEVLRRLNQEIILSIDSTRPIVHHQDGYLEFSPCVNTGPTRAYAAEEYEDMIEPGARDLKKAYMVHEAGIRPWGPIYGRGYGKEIETTAMVAGPEAYQARLGVYPVPKIDETLSEYIRNTYRAWRYHRLDSLGTFAAYTRLLLTPYEEMPSAVLEGKPLNTPGGKPDGIPQWRYQIVNPGWVKGAPRYKPSHGYFALKETFSPLLVYIGGEEEKPTTRDHGFFVKEEIKKSIIAINDKLRDTAVDVKWQVVDNAGNVYYSEKESLHVNCGESVCKGIVFSAPEVEGRTQFFIELEAYEGKELAGKDRFRFEVFPEAKSRESIKEIALYDEAGYTAQALKDIGIDFSLIGTDSKTASTIEIYDEDESVWSVGRSKEGSGNLDISICKETTEVEKGKSSLKIHVTPGLYGQVWIEKVYQAPQDWSDKRFFSCWVYGANSKKNIVIYIGDLNLSNCYRLYLNETWSGWKRLMLRWSSFGAIGTPNLADIQKILFFWYQPGAEGTRYFDDMLVSATQWMELESLKPKVFIIGRESMESNTFDDSVSKFLCAGGNILMLEQTSVAAYPEVLELSLVKHHCRQAFITASGHPIFKGLGNDDFYYWRGESDLIKPAYDCTEPTLEYYERLRRGGCKFGNKGMVNSYGLSKPVEGNFCCLLSNGPDLAITPLLEYQFGKGRIMLCQLDITKRIGKDPVATSLMLNMLDYLCSASPPPSRKVAYLGDKGWEDYLSSLNIAYHRPEKEDDLTNAEVIILGSQVEEAWFNKGLIERLALEGRKVVILPQAEGSEVLGYLPFNLTLSGKEKFVQAVLKSDDPLLWGISNAEFNFCAKETSQVTLYQNIPKEAILLTDPAVVFKIPYRKGEFIFAQLSRELLELKKGARILLSLFTNLGMRTRESIDTGKLAQ